MPALQPPTDRVRIVSIPAAVGEVAAADPAREAVRSGSGVVTFAALEGRSSQLANGLLSLAQPGGQVDIVCCPAHFADLLVAFVACRKAGMLPNVVDVDRCGNSPTLRGDTTSVVIACAEGSSAWGAGRRLGRVIGEGPLARWWRLFERRFGLDVPPRPSTPDAVDDLREEAGVVVHRGSLASGLAALAAGRTQEISRG